MTRALPRLLGLWLASLMVAACATAPPAAGPDPATAARLSAELTAAQTYHEATMRQAGATLAGAALDAVAAAGRRLEAALRVAHAELLVYLEGGPAPDGAFADMRAARANLGMAWEAANE